MNLTHFTPTTLAAMFADLEAAGETTAGNAMMDEIYAVLAANVGEDEAAEMIHAAHVAEGREVAY